MSHLVPTVAAVFVCGIFVPFANGPAALSGMIGGILFGIARAIPYFLLQDYCDDYVDPSSETQVHILHPMSMFSRNVLAEL